MKLPAIRVDVRIAILYILFGGLWILLSDRLLAMAISDPAILTRLQTYKGWVFVVLSALMIFFLLRNELTLRHFTEQKLGESEERYQLISAVALDYMFSDRLNADGQLYTHWVAGAFEGITGFTLDEYTARGGWRSIVHPDDWAQDDRDMEKLRSNQRVESEIRIVAKNEETRWVHIYAHPVIDKQNGELAEIYGAVQDISERKEAEEALWVSEQTLRAIFQQSPLGIAVIDSLTGRFLQVNPKYCQIAGYSEPEMLDLTFQQITHPDDLQTDLDGLQKMLDGQQTPFQMEKRYIRKDGSEIWVALTSVPLWEVPGSEKQHLAMVEDITERRRAEEENSRLNAELEQRVADRTAELEVARQRAESADHLKSAFLATMSHELRTPLNSIIGFTGVLLQGLAGPLNPEQAKQMGMARDSARHLLALINDVLDISKIEAGQLEVKRAPFEIRGAIENAMQLVGPQVQKKGLVLTAAIGSSVGRVVSDQRRVEQILLNLLSNAIKFTEHGEIQLDCHAQDGFIVTSVCDSGIGIRAEDMGKLFEPFRQIETGLNRRHEGTGLGLSICKNLVELLGGQIRVESTWGAGSIFTFTLPLAE